MHTMQQVPAQRIKQEFQQLYEDFPSLLLVSMNPLWSAGSRLDFSVGWVGKSKTCRKPIKHESVTMCLELSSSTT